MKSYDRPRNRRSVEPMSAESSAKVRNARKRAGLTQTELADLCPDVSLAVIKGIEQDTYRPRLYALHQIAYACGVPTTALSDGHDTELADAQTEDLWGPTRRAALTPHEDGEPVTLDAMRGRMEAARALIGESKYTELAAVLPGLLADAHNVTEQGRVIRSRVLNMAGWMLTQTRQFQAAEDVLGRAIDAALDGVDAAAAVNTLAWNYLRQGKLAEARELSVKWADDTEPRFSRATQRQIAVWGRLWLATANAEARDNRPGGAEDALRLARAAAACVGQEVYMDASTVRTFGPITVDHIDAEGHVLTGRPEQTLAIAERTPPATLQPRNPQRLRARLDVAHAYAQTGRYGETVEAMQRTLAVAPEWLVQQRYGRDILGYVIEKRRTLTPDMRELADAIKLEY